MGNHFLNEKISLNYRISDPMDKRSSVISLTEKGRDLIELILPEHARNVDDIFSILTEDEQKELIKILRKFKDKERF